MHGRRLKEQPARLRACYLGRHRHVARHRQKPPVDRLFGEDVVSGESGIQKRPQTAVARKAQPQRRDQPVQPRLEDVPLVETMLAEREPGVDGRRMNGRRRRKAGRPALDVRGLEQGVVGVAFEEAPAEGVEVDEDDPRMLCELRLDQAGQLVEAAVQSSRSTG